MRQSSFINFEEDQLLAAAITVVLAAHRRKRGFWARSSLQARQTYSGSDLYADDYDAQPALCYERRCNGSFKNFLQMTGEDFEYLMCLIGQRMEKKKTTFRDEIPVHEKFVCSLRFLLEEIHIRI
ncbi:hypothetical protein JTB14_010395 [Gonioctena quinquepunctata]|nr:hypothetical protein JTB14_010395 [Gonioctena quinquepunctata]